MTRKFFHKLVEKSEIKPKEDLIELSVLLCMSIEKDFHKHYKEDKEAAIGAVILLSLGVGRIFDEVKMEEKN